MRILHLVKSFSFGGAENHVRELANTMDGLGNNVFVMSKRGQQETMLNKGIKFISLRMKDHMIIFLVLYVIYIILKHKIEVIHAHQRLPVLISSIAGKLTGIPVIVTVHGQTKYDLRSRISKKNPARFIFVRKCSYDQSDTLGIRRNRTVMIQNGVAVSKSDTKKDCSSLCYISRIDKRHSSVILMIIKRVIEPISINYPHVTFNIVGDGEYLSDLRKEAKLINDKLNREVVLIHGYVDDVKKIINKSGLVMGVGRVAIESLSCGVPVMSINKKYFGGLVTYENYPFFKENNFVSLGSKGPEAEGLLIALKEYLKNQDFWHTESGLLQKRVDEDFNIIKITSEITDIYKDTIEELSRNESVLEGFAPYLSRFL